MSETDDNLVASGQITLCGGPWNGRSIEDSGSVQIRMSIYEDGNPTIGKKIGTATYEPSEDRGCAFWLENTWDGTLEGIIPA